jgi:hypothetical protein
MKRIRGRMQYQRRGKVGIAERMDGICSFKLPQEPNVTVPYPEKKAISQSIY